MAVFSMVSSILQAAHRQVGLICLVWLCRDHSTINIALVLLLSSSSSLIFRLHHMLRIDVMCCYACRTFCGLCVCVMSVFCLRFVSGINSQLLFVNLKLTSTIPTHLFQWLPLPFLSTHHSYYPSLPHSFTPGLKPSFSTNPSLRNLHLHLLDWLHGLPGLWALSKWLNLSRCDLGQTVCLRELCIRWGCTLTLLD